MHQVKQNYAMWSLLSIIRSQPGQEASKSVDAIENILLYLMLNFLDLEVVSNKLRIKELNKKQVWKI